MDIYDELREEMLSSSDIEAEDMIEELDNIAAIDKMIKTSEITENQTTQRFKTSDWFNLTSNCVAYIYGLGGVGSWTSLALSRAGFNIKGYDRDTIENVNMSGQLYPKYNIGELKTSEMYRFLQLYNNTSNYSQYSYFYNEDLAFSTIPKSEKVNINYRVFVLAVDSIDLRKQLFKRILEAKEDCKEMKCLLIDSRLSAEYMEVFTVPLDNNNVIEEYKKTFFDSSEAEETPCSYKQTSHCAMIIAGLITNAAINWLCLQQFPFARPLPFKTVFNVAETTFITSDTYDK